MKTSERERGVFFWGGGGKGVGWVVGSGRVGMGWVELVWWGAGQLS